MKDKLEKRLRQFGIEAQVKISGLAESLLDRTWLAMASSHLGKSTDLHSEVCRYISRSMLDARQSGHVLFIAVDSAVEPWARRAADLFSVPVIYLHVRDAGGNPASRDCDRPAGQARIDVVVSGQINRDEVVVALADRVDCVFARPQGKVEQALRLRLDPAGQPVVRVAVHASSVDRKSQIAARALMGQGAVGWYCRSSDFSAADTSESNRSGAMKTRALVSNDWAASGGQWLVHCTRARSGPWPGQTQRQHQDALLLGDTMVASRGARTALESLRRIVRTRRLVGSALATDRQWPVVCFSDQSLRVLLSRRSYRSHLHRWDYEPYGVAIRKSAAAAAGFQPVIYGAPSDRASLSRSQRYRFQAVGKTYDWTQEREWRCAGDVDLDQFDHRDVRLFVAQEQDAKRIADHFEISVVGDYVKRSS